MNEEYNKPLDERTKASNQEKGLRDHFAGLAMQGYCTVDTAKDWTMEEIAHDAYRQADEMLKAREE